MGCDIHTHIEVKIAGKWEHWSAPKIDRWYALFGKLANVRCVDPEHFKIKGFPNDASELTNMHYTDWLGDAHTPSYLALSEMRELDTWVSKDGEYYIGLEYDVLHSYLPEIGELNGNCEDIRMVFWFDN